jgi:hypothetical protein
MFKWLIEEIKARWINDISWTMLYKKIDYAKSKEVKEYFDTSLNQTISKLSRYTEFARTLM